MYVVPKTIKDVTGPNDSPGATVSLKEVLRRDFKRKEVDAYIKTKRKIVVVINGDGASYPVLRKSRRNMLQLSATTTSRACQSGPSLIHRNVSVNCLNVVSAMYAKEDRPAMQRSFEHCKDEIAEISNEGHLDGVECDVLLSGDCKWIRNVLGLQSHACFCCQDVPTPSHARTHSSFCDFRDQSLQARRTFLSMQSNGKENLEKLQIIYEKKKNVFQNQSNNPLTPQQLELCMKAALSSSECKRLLRLNNQIYPPMIESTEEILIALDPLHLLLRQFDIFEQKIIYPILRKENISEDEYQFHLWTQGVDRRTAGISGRAALIWMKNVRDMISVLPEKYHADIIRCVNLFLQIYDRFNSSDYASDKSCEEFAELCWEYGREMNRCFPQTLQSRSLYFHMLKHLPHLLTEFRSGVIGSCHAGESINCVLGHTRERHARSGGPVSDMLKYFYRHTSEDLAGLIPQPKKYAQSLCRVCEQPGRCGDKKHKKCRASLSVTQMSFSVASTFELQGSEY